MRARGSISGSIRPRARRTGYSTRANRPDARPITAKRRWPATNGESGLCGESRNRYRSFEMTVAPPPFIPGAFVGAAHHYRARVYFEDTDLSGIVYHANYLRYMERARSDMQIGRASWRERVCQ